MLKRNTIHDLLICTDFYQMLQPSPVAKRLILWGKEETTQNYIKQKRESTENIWWKELPFFSVMFNELVEQTISTF